MEIRGDAVGFALRTAFFGAVATAMMALVLVGPRWPRLWLAGCFVVVPFLVVMALILARVDRFQFDDKARVLRTPFSPPAPYDAVKRVQMQTFAGITSIGADAGRAFVLLISAPRGREDELRRAFEQRMPAAQFKTTEWSPMWLLAAFVILPALLHIGYARYLESKNPAVAVACEQMDRPAPRAGAAASQAGQFEVLPPQGFQLDTAAERLEWNRPADGGSAAATIRARPERIAGNSRLLLRLLAFALNVEGPADLVGWAACSETGVIPLTLKSVVAPSGADSHRFLEWPGGVAVLSQADDAGRTDLFLNGTGGLDLIARIESPAGEQDALFQEFLAGVSLHE